MREFYPMMSQEYSYNNKIINSKIIIIILIKKHIHYKISLFDFMLINKFLNFIIKKSVESLCLLKKILFIYYY